MNDQETVTLEKTPAENVEAAPRPKATTPAVDAVTAASEEPQDADTFEVAQVEEESPSSETTEIDPAEAEADPNAVSIYTLKPGQHLSGKVKNITDFGAFIDLGIAQDGLVHISELARRKVGKVTDVVSQDQEVEVWVKKVDKKRGRISLTMIKPIKLRLRDISEEAELEGVVTRLESYGAFVDIGSDRDGLVHISQITHDYIKHPEDVLGVGDKVRVKVLKVNRKKRQVDLSIKALLPPPEEVSEEVEEIKEVEKPAEEVREELVMSEQEPMPTAIAIAYAALQGEEQSSSDKSASQSKTRRRQKKEMDDIVARTLANRK